MNVLKIETYLWCTKKKAKKPGGYRTTLNIAIPFSDDEMIIHDLFDLVVNNQGKEKVKNLSKIKISWFGTRKCNQQIMILKN